MRVTADGDFLRVELPENGGAREAVRQEVAKCGKSSGYALITLQPPKKPRTTGEGSQNHHLNGHIMQICQETGNSYKTVKDGVKMTAVQYLGYPYKTIGRQIVPMPESESSTEECAKLIEAVHILAGELGIVLREI